MHYDGITNETSFSYTPRVLWAIRHCERLNEVNPFWFYNNPTFLTDNPPLSERGIKQARQIAERMRYENIDYVFTSPYERCVETAFYILRIRNDNLKMKIEPGLLESLDLTKKDRTIPSFETAERLSLRYNTAEYGDLIDVEYMPAYKGHLDSELGKKVAGCYPRVKNTISKILKKCKGDILIIAHQPTLVAINQALTNIENSANLNPGQATISKYIENIEFPGSFIPEFQADCSHLSEDCRVELRGESNIIL